MTVGGRTFVAVVGAAALVSLAVLLVREPLFPRDVPSESASSEPEIDTLAFIESGPGGSGGWDVRLVRARIGRGGQPVQVTVNIQGRVVAAAIKTDSRQVPLAATDDEAQAVVDLDCDGPCTKSWHLDVEAAGPIRVTATATGVAAAQRNVERFGLQITTPDGVIATSQPAVLRLASGEVVDASLTVELLRSGLTDSDLDLATLTATVGLFARSLARAPDSLLALEVADERLEARSEDRIPEVGTTLSIPLVCDDERCTGSVDFRLGADGGWLMTWVGARFTVGDSSTGAHTRALDGSATTIEVAGFCAPST